MSEETEITVIHKITNSCIKKKNEPIDSLHQKSDTLPLKKKAFFH